MGKSLYWKLAQQNIKKNKRAYFPYIIASICMVALYYIFHSIPEYPGLSKVRGGDSVIMLLNMGSGVMAFFTIIFLFYINSFLIKQRKKELGLYCVLGMEKRHISHVLMDEMILVAGISIVGGLLCGLLFSKVAYVILLRILGAVVQLGFVVAWKGIRKTVVLFGILFFVLLIYNMSRVHLINPVELLSGGNAGEKEPKTKWIQAILGFATLGGGYYLANTVASPIAAINTFLLAVVLVMVGTYLLFSAGSIALLKLLKKHKKYYYQTKHFVAISGLIYRMKQNAVGLANICILSTAVLVTLSTTVCIYTSLDETLRNNYGRDVTVSSQALSDEDKDKVDKKIQKVLEDYQIQPVVVEKSQDINVYEYQEGDSFNYKDVDNMSSSSMSSIKIMEATGYEEMTGDQVELQSGEALIGSLGDKYVDPQITISGQTFQIVGKLPKTKFCSEDYVPIFSSSYVVVVSSRSEVEAIYDAYMKETGEVESGAAQSFEYAYSYGMDLDCEADTQIELKNTLAKELEMYPVNVKGIEAARESFMALHGGLLFVGIFLGIVFLMATVLIIYYKQISEGFEDKKRFEIMCKVGMGHLEVKTSIHSQILTVFFFPVVLAGVHLIAAYPCIKKILAMFGLMNGTIFIITCIATYVVFLIVYAIVYLLTAKIYLGIVEGD